jgi:toxin-antitoxin system PIN domain toxin
VNLLIALLDASHAFHSRAHAWWGENATFGWASCPLTENGVVRIMTNPAYSAASRFTIEQIVESLNRFVAATDHEFWEDDISLRDTSVFTTTRMHSSRQLTDLYLLGLAVKHGGCLTTFDQAIPLSAVKKASAANLSVL